MAEKQKQEQGQVPREVLGVEADEMTYDLSVSGKPTDTVWDDMVNALHPKYGPEKGQGGK